jgi:cytidyltransferase-like protein
MTVTRVLTTGVFDLFHVGHLRALEKAKAFGNLLIVGVSTDEDAARYKRLPIIPFKHRVEILRGLKCVDEVVQCPLYIDQRFYVDHRIDVHCQGDEGPSDYSFYADGSRLGILRILGRDSEIDSTRIIAEICSRPWNQRA